MSEVRTPNCRSILTKDSLGHPNLSRSSTFATFPVARETLPECWRHFISKIWRSPSESEKIMREHNEIIGPRARSIPLIPLIPLKSRPDRTALQSSNQVALHFGLHFECFFLSPFLSLILCVPSTIGWRTSARASSFSSDSHSSNLVDFCGRISARSAIS